mgnify:CR=1 FL=1|tara:strand:+ start:94 stop:438 length:345 start_codon:yes stop_codon:yes gene_type:complete
MIFVFGSNLAGLHGKGAAKHAAWNYGAQQGIGEGITGLAYAIPTKGRKLEALPFSDIDAAICRFLEYAKAHRGDYMLTPIGTGLAGHSKRRVWSVLAREGLPSNVYLTSTWVTE